jgi:Patatin-like phospholipase
MALCLSGGGIRSATFALGVIQGLAERGVLNAFDYLSTVSGGGYTGAWLTCWTQRAKGLDKVIPQLRRDARSVPEGSPDPIQHLREYNNFLSPKLGLFSADTWTLAATVGRNMFLNWLVFVPLLLAALMAPRLLLSIARLGETFFAFYNGSQWLNPNVLSKVIPAISMFFFAMTIFNILRYLPGVGGKHHSEIDFLKYCLLPLVIATVALITNDSWFTGGDLTRAGAEYSEAMGYRTLTLGVVAAAFAGWVAYLIFCGKSLRERGRLFLPVSGGVLLTSWSAGSAAWLLADRVYPSTSWPVYTTVAAPLLLVAMLLAACLFVGVTSQLLQDEDREWLSRAGAWVLLLIVSWTGASALVLILPSWVLTLPVWGKSALAAAGTVAGWTSALTGSSSRTKSDKESRGNGGAPPPSMLMSLAMKLAAPVFAGAFLVGLAILTDWILMASGLGAHSEWDEVRQSEVFTRCPNCAWWDHQAMLNGTHSEADLALGLAFLAFGWLMARFININKFSLQGMYRNRLIRAYLGASNPSRDANDFTGFAQSDNILIHQLDATLKPLQVVNLTLNLVAGQRLAWQQRKATSFTMTPLHCGNSDLGYRSSLKYGGPDGVSLGTAIAISGAAASPNMGYNSSPVIAFIMTLFNARLGSWLGNPGKAGLKTWREEGPTSAIASIVREAFSLTDDTSQYVYLSDGGHFENLGIYEMVRRRCRYIVVSDAGCDPRFTYEDLGNALRKLRIDMKIHIDFEDGSFQSLREQTRRCAIARIRYSLVDNTQEDGYLLYIKPMMRGNESPDVASYQSRNTDFPHQSTADQFFDESQTESYRMLGLETVDEICAGWDQSGGISGMFQHVSGVYFKNQRATAMRIGSAG